MTRRLAREDMGLLERAHASRLGWGPFYAGGATLVVSVLLAEASLWPWVAVTLGPTVLALVAWSLSRLDGWLHEIYSLSCIGVAVYFVFWARSLPLTFELTTVREWSVWVAFLFGTSVLMGIGWWSSKTKRTEVHLEDELRGWSEIASNFGLGSTSRHIGSRDGDGNESGFLIWPRGAHTVRQVLDAREKLEGAMGMPEGTLRLVKHGKDTNRVDYFAFRDNPTTEAQEWPGPQQSDDGGDLSVDVACRVGVAEDREIVELPYIDRSNSFVANKLLGGTQGSGKSGGMTLHIADLACRSDATQWGMDMKGGAEITPWDKVMDAIVISPLDSVPMIEALDAILSYREKKIVELGRKSWPCTPEYPLLVVWIDELQRLLAALGNRDRKQVIRCEEVMVRVATTGRALGVSVNGATQNPTLEATKTSQFRDRLNQRICFRTEKEGHEDYILNNRRAGSHLIDSSASGVCFIQDRDNWTGVPVRYYYVTDWMIQQVCEIRAPGLPLDEGSAEAARTVWREYATRCAERYGEGGTDGSPDGGTDGTNVVVISDPVPDGGFVGPNVGLPAVYDADAADPGYTVPQLPGPNVGLSAVYDADAALPSGEAAVWSLLEARGVLGATAKELFMAASKSSSWFHSWKLPFLADATIVQPHGSLGPYVLSRFGEESGDRVVVDPIQGPSLDSSAPVEDGVSSAVQVEVSIASGE